jgi:hypothetical protein
MGDDNRNVTFNIGTQEGVNTNVAGDMTVYGGQHYTVSSPEEARRELADIREALAKLELGPDVVEEASALIDEADHELARPEPRPDKVGGPIERLTTLVSQVGGLAAAGAALVEPLQRIGTWLGTAGQGILRLIG